MKDALKKCKIAVTGDFGNTRSYDKIKQWIEHQGGELATKINPDVTHLVCSQEHFKRSVAMVKNARKIKGCKIVTFDWLEDSLMSFSSKRTGPYLMKGIVKARAKAKVEQKEKRDMNIKTGLKKFEKGCDDFKATMMTDGYHIYRSPSGFAYDITLVRHDLTTNTSERYQLKVSNSVLTPLYPSLPLPRRTRVPLPRPRTQCLQLYESHSPPYKYACYVTYSSPKAGSARQILAPLGSSWDLALGVWRQFFRVKVGQSWTETETGEHGGVGEGDEIEGSGVEESAGNGKGWVYVKPDAEMGGDSPRKVKEGEIW